MRSPKYLSLALLLVGLVAVSPVAAQELVFETVLQPDIEECDTLHNTRNCENYHVDSVDSLALNHEIVLNQQTFVIKNLAIAYHLASGEVERQPISSWANDGSFVAPESIELSTGGTAQVLDVRLNLTVVPK